jgi:hypothetical protein
MVIRVSGVFEVRKERITLPQKAIWPLPRLKGVSEALAAPLRLYPDLLQVVEHATPIALDGVVVTSVAHSLGRIPG